MSILLLELIAAMLIGLAVAPGDFKALFYCVMGVIVMKLAVRARTMEELQSTKKESKDEQSKTTKNY